MDSQTDTQQYSIHPSVLFLLGTLLLTSCATAMLCAAIMTDHWEYVTWNQTKVVEIAQTVRRNFSSPHRQFPENVHFVHGCSCRFLQKSSSTVAAIFLYLRQTALLSQDLTYSLRSNLITTALLSQDLTYSLRSNLISVVFHFLISKASQETDCSPLPRLDVLTTHRRQTPLLFQDLTYSLRSNLITTPLLSQDLTYSLRSNLITVVFHFLISKAVTGEDSSPLPRLDHYVLISSRHRRQTPLLSQDLTYSLRSNLITVVFHFLISKAVTGDRLLSSPKT
ncbi:hypothetical protein J6590_039446 [Homalodisca vitripennis]|nr:hypothetical protein J6590_039446 [Homalodisca vitripennis]